jgi:predicted anti-sigma-YlaC factor YlaD
VNDACKNTEMMIQEYLDGRLSDRERRSLEAHLSTCPSCRADMEAFAVLVTGLENMPLEEPSTGFNAAVLGRIAFPRPEAVPVRRGLSRLRLGILGGVAVTVFSTLVLFLMIAGSGRISYVLSSGFLKAIGVMEWLSMTSIQGMVDLVRVFVDLPILSSLLSVGRIFVNVASTTMTDPLCVFILTVMTLIGAASCVIMAKLMRPSVTGISVNGGQISLGG